MEECESWEVGKEALLPPPVPPLDIKISGKENATLVTTTRVNNRTVQQTLVFKSDVIPDRGSDEMFDAIFKASKSYGKLSKEDLEEIERDKAKFWGTSAARKKKTTSTKTKSKPKLTSKTTTNPIDKKSKSSSSDMDLSQDQDTLDLLAEAAALMMDDCPSYSTEDKTSSQASSCHSPKPKRPAKSKKTKDKGPTNSDTRTYDLLEISDNEDMFESKSGGETKSQQLEPDPWGNLVFFYVNLRSERYPIRINEKKKILDVRKMLGEKAALTPECITMFLGDDIQLEDHQTVAESGLVDFCNVDAYYKDQSIQDLYMADNTEILRFKLQTADRRGRQTVYIYAKKSEPMRKVRDQYAKEVGLEPSQLRLMFDGDCIDLDGLPFACDLEGEECIDVIIK